MHFDRALTHTPKPGGRYNKGLIAESRKIDNKYTFGAFGIDFQGEFGS
jgi:hypothetical protein